MAAAPVNPTEARGCLPGEVAAGLIRGESVPGAGIQNCPDCDTRLYSGAIMCGTCLSASAGTARRYPEESRPLSPPVQAPPTEQHAANAKEPRPLSAPHQTPARGHRESIPQPTCVREPVEPRAPFVGQEQVKRAIVRRLDKVSELECPFRTPC